MKTSNRYLHVTAQFTFDQIELMKKVCKDNGISRNALLRQLVDSHAKYFKKNRKIMVRCKKSEDGKYWIPEEMKIDLSDDTWSNIK